MFMSQSATYTDMYRDDFPSHILTILLGNCPFAQDCIAKGSYKFQCILGIHPSVT